MRRMTEPARRFVRLRVSPQTLLLRVGPEQAAGAEGVATALRTPPPFAIPCGCAKEAETFVDASVIDLACSRGDLLVRLDA